MTDIGELVVRIKADAAQLEREMQKANGIVKQSAGQMESRLRRPRRRSSATSSPPSPSPPSSSSASSAIDAAGHINDLAARIGFAGSTLSALEIPLSVTAPASTSSAAAINRMNNMIGEAAKGNQEAVKAFDALGLSVRKLQQLSPEEQFYADRRGARADRQTRASRPRPG